MSPASLRAARALFVAYVAATALHIGWVMAHEPFAFDAWNVANDTGAKPFSIASFLAYWKLELLHSNPRLGQPLTYLAYKVVGFAEIVSPLAYLALALAIVTLALGRWPSWKRGRDLALYAFVLGAIWFALPQIAKTLFCRAYGANYVYGAVIQLWFVVALVLAREGASPVRLVLYALAGLAAGLCNEHTGPTLALFALGFAWWTQRTGDARARVRWAGAAGVVLGFSALFFAPGQGQRYEGLATKMSLMQRLLSRGIVGNFDIVRDLIAGAAPLLGLVAIVAVIAAFDGKPDDSGRRRRAITLLALAAAASLLVAATLFVSPKLGSRFFLVPMALVLAGLVALADEVLVPPRSLAPLVAFAVIASIYAAARTVPLFAHLARDSEARLAQLAAAPRGSTVTIDAWEQVDENWWFLGDDFRDLKKRELVASYFGLGEVVFRSIDASAPLGVSDARFVARAHLDPPGCLDDFGGLALPTGSYRPTDLASIKDAFAAAVAPLRARLGATRVDAIELTVEFAGTHAALPRPELLVARWTPAGITGYAGALLRHGRERNRQVAVPADLPHDMDVYIYAVGGEAKRLGTAAEPLHYVPWQTGMYWALACDARACFVIAAGKQGG